MYNFTTETQGLDTFRVCEIEMNTQLDTAGLGMLLNNKIAGLCPVSSIQMDNRRYIRYNISSQIPLKQFFMDKVDKKRFLRILHNVLMGIESIEDYMLDPGMLILDKEEIYVNVGSLQTDLIYYPLIEERKEFDIHAFVKNMIMSTEFDTEEQDNYVTLLISYLNHTEHVTVTSLKEYVATLLQGVVEKTTRKSIPTPMMPQEPVMPMVNVPVQQSVSMQSQIQVPVIESNTTKRKSNFFSFVSLPKKEKEKKEKVKKEKKIKTHKEKMGKEIVAPGGIVIPYMDNTKNSTLPAPPKPMGAPILNQMNMSEEQYIQSAMPVRQEQYVQPAMSVRQEQYVQSAMPVQQEQYVQSAMPVQQEQYVQPVIMPKQELNLHPIFTQNQARTEMAGETRVLGAGISGATTVLSEGYNTVQRQRNPYLLRKKTNQRVEIDRNVFRIGKESSYVDYCISDNTAVSRSHADIIRKNDEFYIVDNNSLNHTFLNGVQIPSSQMYKLEDYMVIKLADEVFEFIL